MRRYKVIEVNKDGKIEFTKKELEDMLNTAYDDGYSDGYSASTPYKDHTTVTWRTPNPIPTYKDYFTCPPVTCNDSISTTDESKDKNYTITGSSSCCDVDGQTTDNITSTSTVKSGLTKVSVIPWSIDKDTSYE